MSDLISRQDAIEDAREAFKRNPTMAIRVMDLIKSMPSVKTELLTDKEQRIFLAAMAREEEVCKQVDDEWRDMDSNVENLVRVCQEIKRKVKGALWT